MKFTVSTKPLKTGLNLCIVVANISEYHNISKLVQITATANTLCIKHAALETLSEVRFKGLGEGEISSMLVDAKLFKRLVSTLTSSETMFEFTQNALVIHAGKSSFTVPKIMDTSEAELPTPAAITEVDIANSTEINATDWKFIKDRQLFALSAADVNPVYKYVWIGESGDALVGDFAKSLFTHSKIEKIGKSCLLTNTVVNLIDSLPSGAKIINRESNYSISVKTDGYELVSEFTPKYESAEVGNYNAGIIINLMQTDENTSVTANADDIYTVLNQADILNTDKQPNIVCTVESKQITFHDNNVNCTIPVEGDHEFKYSITLDTVLLRSVISRCPESTISISPSIRENNVVGIVLSSGRLNVVLSGLS